MIIAVDIRLHEPQVGMIAVGKGKLRLSPLSVTSQSASYFASTQLSRPQIFPVEA